MRESKHDEWQKEFKRRDNIERNWMNGKLRSHQLFNTANDISHHGNLLATVQFPKLIKCIHFEEGILATASNDNLIKLWDITHTRAPSHTSSHTPSHTPPHAREYVPHATLSGHSSLIQHMQFHRNVLVSGSLDGIHVWNMSEGECVKVIHENERCYQLQFEDAFLVHGHTFGFKVWDLHTHQMLRDENGQFSVTCLAFKSRLDPGFGSGHLMACATHWGDVALWDLRHYKLNLTLRSSAHQIQISGNTLAVACDGGVEIYDLRTNTLQHVLQFDQDVTSIHIKGDNLLIGCTAGFVRVMHLGKMREQTIVVPQLDRFIGFMQTDWEHLVIKSNFNVGICYFGDYL